MSTGQRVRRHILANVSFVVVLLIGRVVSVMLLCARALTEQRAKRRHLKLHFLRGQIASAIITILLSLAVAIVTLKGKKQIGGFDYYFGILLVTFPF